MNQILSEWVNIAEITGALMIIISLIHVGMRVSDATNAFRSASTSDLVMDDPEQ